MPVIDRDEEERGIWQGVLAGRDAEIQRLLLQITALQAKQDGF